MKRGATWYKRDPIAALDGYQGLGPDVIGAYNVLLDLIYARGGETTRDDRHLAGILGCSTRKAKALTERLLELGKIQFRDGFVTNSRAEKDAKESRNISEARANAGRIGGENGTGDNKNRYLAQASTQANASKEKRREEKELASHVDMSKGKEAVTAEFVGALVEALGQGHDHLISAAMSQLAEWTDQGFTRRDILNTVRDVANRHNYPIADKLGYFTDAIAEAAAKRRAKEPLAPDEITPDQWRTAVRFHLKTKQWSAPGSPPGFEGCLVPPEVCAEFPDAFTDTLKH